MVCEIMNDFSMKLSVWCFDQKWWLHAYIGKTTYDLRIYIYIYMYVYDEQDSVFKSALEKFTTLFVSSNALNRSSHRDTLVKVYPRIFRGFYGVSLKTLHEREWSS
jgi:hypothetical protein